MRHFCSLLDVRPDELNHLIELALRLKREKSLESHRSLLAGRVLGLMFEKPSLRTRVSLEAAVAHCGGSSVFLTNREVGVGQREAVQDFARVMSQYVDVFAARTFSHEMIVAIAKYAQVPVINALSDAEHPCQALADLCTIREFCGAVAGKRIVFVGDGNNVARSLAHAAVLAEIDFVLCAPPGYAFDPEFVASCMAKNPKARIAHEPDPAKAVQGAHVVYTDVWASMGQEAESDARRRVFLPYQVNGALMARAQPDARFMHCLPAHRGDEVTDEVIDSPQSVVIEQAANRLHAQKALMLWLLGQDKDAAVAR